MKITYVPRELESIALQCHNIGADVRDTAELLQNELRLCWKWDIPLTFATDVVEYALRDTA